VTRLLIAYVATAVVFLILDGVWLTLAAPRLYRPEIGHLLADKVQLGPAIAFYLLYVAGMVWFCVRPNLGAGWGPAALSGVVLGLVAYGAYDLTCQATMRDWSIKVTVADLAWGAFATATASGAGVFLTRLIAGRGGA
jgi:uncharacterized membrane protein